MQKFSNSMYIFLDIALLNHMQKNSTKMQNISIVPIFFQKYFGFNLYVKALFVQKRLKRYIYRNKLKFKSTLPCEVPLFSSIYNCQYLWKINKALTLYGTSADWDSFQTLHLSVPVILWGAPLV